MNTEDLTDLVVRSQKSGRVAFEALVKETVPWVAFVVRGIDEDQRSCHD